MNVVAHNLPAMNTRRQFNINTKNKAKSMQKLSSGYRINSSADDAAGLSISEKMRSQIRGLSQGIRNTETGVSLCQVADGALSEVSEMLHRITELSIQSANDTNTYEDRTAIQQEIGHIIQEIDRISDTTEFNTKKIFGEKVSGTIIDTNSGKWILPAIIKEEHFEIRYNGYRGQNAVFDGKTYRIGQKIQGTWLTLGEKSLLQNSSDRYNNYTNIVLNGASFPMISENMQENTTNEKEFSRIIGEKNNVSSLKISDLKVDSNGFVYIENWPGRGKMYACLYDQYTDDSKGLSFANSNNTPGIEYLNAKQFDDSENVQRFWIQSGSQAKQGMFLEIDHINTSILGINNLDVSTSAGANHALNAVHSALDKVSANRSKIGAQQNRLEHTIANEENIVENTTSAESHIRDTDMAKEMVTFSKARILENVEQAMLAQANKSNQFVSSLLS